MVVTRSLGALGGCQLLKKGVVGVGQAWGTGIGHSDGHRQLQPTDVPCVFIGCSSPVFIAIFRRHQERPGTRREQVCGDLLQ